MGRKIDIVCVKPGNVRGNTQIFWSFLILQNDLSAKAVVIGTGRRIAWEHVAILVV
jgi:hypothetical protein